MDEEKVFCQHRAGSTVTYAEGRRDALGGRGDEARGSFTMMVRLGRP